MTDDTKFKRKARAAGWEQDHLHHHLYRKGVRVITDHDLAELLNEMDAAAGSIAP